MNRDEILYSMGILHTICSKEEDNDARKALNTALEVFSKLANGYILTEPTPIPKPCTEVAYETDKEE